MNTLITVLKLECSTPQRCLQMYLFGCRTQLKVNTDKLHELKSVITDQEEELRTLLAGQDSAPEAAVWQQAERLQASTTCFTCCLSGLVSLTPQAHCSLQAWLVFHCTG